MSSFVRWVLLYDNQDNMYGDVARDIRQDERINRRWGYRRFVRHLTEINADYRVFEIVADLNFHYKNFKKNK